MDKNFSTPSRPITRDQLNTIKQRFVKETPGLYQRNVLSYPKDSKQATQNVAENTTRDPLFNLRNLSLNSGFTTENKSSVPSHNEEILPDQELNDSQTLQLGNFENPILSKLLKRSINKEYEFNKIVTNIIGLSIWNLMINFIDLFVKHSSMGRQMYARIYTQIWDIKWVHIIYSNVTMKSIIDNLTSRNINYLFHILVCYNLIIATWRLFSNGKINDLNLSNKQKQLLGIQDKKSKSEKYEMNKPHIIETNRTNNISNANGNILREAPVTPFLFKSLKSPLRTREEQEITNGHNAFGQTHNHEFTKTNVFGDIRKTAINNNYTNTYVTPMSNVTTTAQTNKSYVASPKYTYLMNSPRPNHM
ncbi:hypothetical protein C6P45_000816 [Maudiozyma exigua]|uniref:Nucleoporin POM34 n=1 Tax=Maudiozyma exigua TaxID=34358 RepID=A0A9P7BCQ1_MAUEX|nr:hypothetical protein C6P45_000816 [Kazachstania exigua]